MGERHPVFDFFTPWSGVSDGRFAIDFLGCLTDPKFWKNVRTQPVGHVQTGYPIPHEQYFEWIGLLSALKEATLSDTPFVMFELGAGWAPWLGRAAVYMQSIGRECQLVAVEADAAHAGFIREHLVNNRVDPSAHRLLYGAAGPRDGWSLFPISGEPSQHYGGASVDLDRPDDAIARWLGYADMNAVPEGVPVSAPNGQSLLKVRTYGLPALMEPFDRIDLIHMDIQGAELPVVTASIADLAQKVRRLIVGTHSDSIHDSLVDIFRSNGFEAEFLFPRRDMVQTDYGPIQFRDGCQVWSNPNV
jgi:FkbM family methyltransferase